MKMLWRMSNLFRAAGLAFVCMGVGSGFASADGPDFYQIREGSNSKPLVMRAKPGSAQSVGSLPADASCIRNLGCQGSDLSAKPRWCKVEHQGKVGWVEGKFLAEGACANPSLNFSGVVTGVEAMTYRVPAKAGQTLSVTLNAKHPQTYFNVTLAGSQEAMFIGSTSGNAMRKRIAADGEYTVEVYLMRAAARRGTSSAFSLSVDVQGQPLEAIAASSDALVAGTPFHATARVVCTVPYDPNVTACDAGVIRRGLDGTATVQVKWAQGLRHFLFMKGALAASDSTQQVNASRQGDQTLLRIGKDEVFAIPDVLLRGG
jgi:hypothetical protein